MRMRGKKPLFSYKDTWSLEMTLSPIICEGLKKFLEVISSEDNCAGCPNTIFIENNLDPESKEDFDKALEIWYDELQKMIFAFDPNNEPKIEDYDFDYLHRNRKESEDGTVRYSLESTNKDEEERYNNALKEYAQKCEEGRMSFCKFYDSLWW